MVFFTCSHCGESVKKPAVAKHYQTKCGKKEPFLTCIDCLKDFKGAEYEAHTKCVSEEEKYAAKGSATKQAPKKGEKKQQTWHECFKIVLQKSSLKPDEKDLITVISKYQNVPRKKGKFIKFLANAFKQFAGNTDLIDRVWAELESVYKESSANAIEMKKQQAQLRRKEEKQEKQQLKLEKQEGKNAPNKPNPKPEESAGKKKRKRQAEEDKAAEGGDSGKNEDNQKKKKQKQIDEKPAVGNDDVLMSKDNECKRGKINRKRKAGESGQTEQNDSVPDGAEPGKKKKKKKLDKPAENQASETPAQKPGVEAKNKKRIRKPKAEGEQTKKNNATMGAGDSSAAKKEKKMKKSENKENEKAPPAADSVEGEAKKPPAKKPPAKKKPAAKAESGGEESKQEAQFDWKATILQVLKQDGKNNRIQLQKLQKRVLTIHCQVLKCEPNEKKEKKFTKKLKEMSEIVLDKDFVVLKS